MADMLATVADLRTLLGEDSTGLTDAEAELLLQLATSTVQAASGQVIVERTETLNLMGTTESWLDLPQLPVTAVTSVSVDGEVVTDYKRFGARLWRESGWASSAYEPAEIAVSCTHGYASTDPDIQFARNATLAVAARMFTNPIGATGLSVDDYSEQYSQSTNSDLAGLIPDRLQKALKRRYGPRGRLARIG